MSDEPSKDAYVEDAEENTSDVGSLVNSEDETGPLVKPHEDNTEDAEDDEDDEETSSDVSMDSYQWYACWRQRHEAAISAVVALFGLRAAGLESPMARTNYSPRWWK